MQTDVAETIFEMVKVLPSEEQQKVLEFVIELKPEESGIKSLLRKIEEKSLAIPDEVWDELPSDGSINHDHYLYGSPKRQ